MMEEIISKKKEVIQKWSGIEGANAVYPLGSSPNLLEDRLNDLREMCIGQVCDVGCGDGRCAVAFDANRYVGLDINNVAIDRARERLPEHDFRVIDWDDDYPEADTYLFYTCLLHVPDEEMPNVLSRLQHRVVIFESMSRALRKMGSEFQRDVDEYVQWFCRFGYIVVSQRRDVLTTFPFFSNFSVFKRGE